eukprot:231146-Pleurochrysis_carterae.AAC.1
MSSGDCLLSSLLLAEHSIALAEELACVSQRKHRVCESSSGMGRVINGDDIQVYGTETSILENDSTARCYESQRAGGYYENPRLDIQRQRVRAVSSASARRTAASVRTPTTYEVHNRGFSLNTQYLGPNNEDRAIQEGWKATWKERRLKSKNA